MIDDRKPSAREPWEDEAWVRDLDALVRPSFVVSPPAHVQQTILAAVLLAAAAQPVAAPIAVPAPAADAQHRPLPWLAYVLFAAVVVAYIAGVSWLQGLFGNVTWLSILAEQLLAVSQQAFGRDTGAPMAVIWQLFLQAPWVALLPVAWLLWDRDRTSAPTA